MDLKDSYGTETKTKSEMFESGLKVGTSPPVGNHLKTLLHNER